MFSGGGGDSSAAWQTASGEWHFISRNNVNNSVWGNTEGFFMPNKWYEFGPQPGFTQGAHKVLARRSFPCLLPQLTRV
jgi:hypothetical protein